jgi:hypothetical protein
MFAPMPRSPSFLTVHATIPSASRLQSANHRFPTAFFSAPSESLFPQLLCFQNYLSCPLLFFNSPKVSATLRPNLIRANAFTLSAFRMNTCKTVSKQRTLSPFRMNTCEKTGGRGSTGSYFSMTERLKPPLPERSLAQKCASPPVALPR